MINENTEDTPNASGQETDPQKDEGKPDDTPSKPRRGRPRKELAAGTEGGRPKGATSKPSEGPADGAPKTRRKTVAEVRDTGAAIKSRAKELNELIAAHNKAHPGGVPVAKVADNPLAVRREITPIPVEHFRAAIDAIVEGEAMLCDTAPEMIDDRQRQSCALAWHNLSKVVQIDLGIWIAGGMAAITTIPIVAAPIMVRMTYSREERQGIKQLFREKSTTNTGV